MPDYSNLDRSWQVNGRELAEALRPLSRSWTPPENPERRAAHLLRLAGAIEAHPDDCPSCASGDRAQRGYDGRVTATGQPLQCADEWHDVVEAHVCCEHSPGIGELADALAGTWQIRTINGQLRSGELTDRTRVARAVLDALDGEDPTDPPLPDAPRDDAAVLQESIRTGTPLRADEDEAEPPDTVPWETRRELAALERVAEVMESCGGPARKRVLAWAAHRYDIEIAPY